MDWVEELMEKLGSPNLLARENAIIRLSENDDSRIVPALIELLKNGNKDEQESSARALGYIKDERAVTTLIETLRNENLSVRLSASTALGRFGQSAVPFLIEALNISNSNVREYALRALGDIKDVQAVPAIISVLNDINAFPNVICNSEMALDKIADANPGNPSLTIAVFPLIVRMNDLDSNVRAWAAMALGKIGDIRAVQPLIERLGRIECAELVAREIIIRCKTTQHLEDFEIGLQKGYDNLKKSAKTSELLFRIQIRISRLMTEVAKKRDELAQDKGILLTDTPKPPKKGGVYQQIRRTVRNG